MTGDSRQTSGRKLGKPKGARNKRTIARLVAMETREVREDGKLRRKKNYLVALTVLQQLALARKSEDAARLYDQISDAVLPQPPADPELLIMMPVELELDAWEARAAQIKDAKNKAPKSLLERIRESQARKR